jgi:putative nucleotidyltransferase with HDIG domain
LDVSSFESAIEPVIEPRSETPCSREPQKIQDITAMVRQVKPIPQVALKLIRMIHNHDYDIGDIAQVVYGDQVISARVISLCNSAIFGLSSPVSSIQRALVMLGERQLLQVIMLASVQTYFTAATQGYSLCKGGLFQHGIRTAVICSVLAQTIGRVETDTAFTAGLLHDIGKTALDQYVATVYPFFYREMTQEHRQLIAVEKELLGVTHAEVGMHLARSWSLPEPLIESIALHHHPRSAAVFPELTAIVSIADGILSFFQAGEEIEHLHADVLLDALGILGLRLSDVPRLVDAIPVSVFKHTMLF